MSNKTVLMRLSWFPRTGKRFILGCRTICAHIYARTRFHLIRLPGYLAVPFFLWYTRRLGHNPEKKTGHNPTGTHLYWQCSTCNATFAPNPDALNKGARVLDKDQYISHLCTGEKHIGVGTTGATPKDYH